MITNIFPKKGTYLLINLVCRDEGHPELADLVADERERRFVQTIVAICISLIKKLLLASLRMILPLASLKFQYFCSRAAAAAEEEELTD